MADSYQVVSQRETVQVLSQTQVLDVEEVGFVTKPHGIYAQREVPLAAWAAEGAGAWIEPLATAIEGLMQTSAATFATFVQDVDASGLLTDYLDVTVSYTPAGGLGIPMTTVVRIPINAFTVDTQFGIPFGTDTFVTPADAVASAYNALIATANL